jgi:hypothetical protein
LNGFLVAANQYDHSQSSLSPTEIDLGDLVGVVLVLMARDPSLDFLSDQFDAQKALTTPGTLGDCLIHYLLAVNRA